MAGEQGFEPQLSHPECDVLPIKLFPSSSYFAVEVCGYHWLSTSTFLSVAQIEARSKFTG